MSVQPETNRFHYLNLHEQLHHRIAESCPLQPALCDAIERTRARCRPRGFVWRVMIHFLMATRARRHQELLWPCW